MKINSKKKGNSGELECSKIFNERFECAAFRRSPSSGAFVGGDNRAKSVGLSDEAKNTLVSDLICPSDFTFIIEHKSYEKIEFWDLFNEKSKLKAWMEQVTGDAAFVEKEPLLIIKCNRKERICFVKKEFAGHVFKYGEWYCGYLTDLLKEEKQYFFVESKEKENGT